MGVFDGVHVGHQTLLRATRATADDLGVAAVALIFEPHPREVLGAGIRVPRLTDASETLHLIERDGVRAILTAFDRDVSLMTPEAFVDALAPNVEPAALVMTPDSAFGHRRSGTPDHAAAIGRERGFSVRVLALVEVDGEPASSTRARAAVAAGELEAARRLLGRPAAFVAEASGIASGRLVLHYTAALPPDGDYDVRVEPLEGGEPRDAVLSIGESGGLIEIDDIHDAHGGGPTLESNARLRVVLLAAR